MNPFQRFSLRTSIVAVSIHTVVAANGVWTNPAGGSWVEPTNWSGSTIADGAGSVADFSTLDLAADAVVTMDGDKTLGSLLFSDTTPGSNWTVNAGVGGLLTFSSSGVPSVSVANGTTTIGAVVAGTQGFQKLGAGTLTLSGANTFAGQLQVMAGTLKAGVAGSLGASGVGNETVAAAGGTFDINGQALTNTEIFRISGTGVGGAGALVNTGGDQQNALNRLVLDGNATVGGTARFDLRSGTTPTLDLAGFTLSKTGTNQFSIVGSTITSGSMAINSGTLSLETTTTADANGTITINSPGILGLYGNTAASLTRPIVGNSGTIQNLGSNATLNSPISIVGGTNLTVTGTATTYAAGVISGTGNLVKSGTGAFTFAGGNTFVGKTTINQGYFGVTGETGFGPTPAVFVADNITLANGTTGGIGNVVNGFYYGPTYSASRGIYITEAGGGVEAYGHEGGRSRVTVNGVISGPGTLYKTGGGSLFLNAVNTYAGGTVVSTGPLPTENVGAVQIGNYGGLSSGALTFANTGSITGLEFANSGTLPNNIVLTDGTFTNRFYVDPGRTATIGGLISGGNFSGGVLQVDGGTLIMQGAQPYLSGTIVNSGALLVNGTLNESDVTANSGGAIGGTGSVRFLTLQDGSRIITSTPALVSTLGITANKSETGKGVEVIVNNTPATPGTRTVDVIGYGDGEADGFVPNLANFNTSAYRSATFTDDTVNNKIKLTYTNSGRTWNVADGVWDVATTTSWLEDDLKFYQGDVVTFNNPAAAATVTLTGALAPAAVTVNNTNNYTFSGTGSIVGGSLTKSGTGMLVLTGSNTYPGGTTINGGTISISASATASGGGSPGALGTGPVTINTGGILKLWINNGATTPYANPVILEGGRVHGEDGVNVLEGGVAVGAGGGILSAKWNNKNLVVNSVITGAGKLTVQRDSTGGETSASVIFNKANTYTGGTDLFSGFLRVANSDAGLGTGALTFTGNSTLATAVLGGARNFTNPVVINTGVTGSLDGGQFPLTLSGVVSGPGTLSSVSSGTVILSGTNTYTGGTNFTGTGVLRVDSLGALASTGTLSFSGGALQYTAANTTDYSARFSAAATQTYKTDTNGQNVTWASPLTSVGGSITKVGLGTLTLTGASTYSGGTNAQGGVIETALISDTGATPIGTFSTAANSFISFGGGTFRYTGAASVTTARYMWNDQVSATFQVTDAAATVAFTSTGGTLNKPFTKTGAGTLTLADTIDGTATVTVSGGRLNLNGTNTYTGDTTVTAGTLSLAIASLPNAADVKLSTGATLNLGFTGTDDIDQLFIDGVEMAKGTWGGVSSTATNKTALITGTGILNVVTGPASASGYDAWATATGLTATNNGKAMDPDGDGVSNLAEFAFDSIPLSGASSGKMVTKIATIGGVNVLTLTLPVRAGATFSGTTEMVSALIDGMTYHVQGTTTLTSFPLQVLEVTGADATAVQAGLPALSSSAWTYRTFRAAGDTTTDAKKFLRATVE